MQAFIKNYSIVLLFIVITIVTGIILIFSLSEESNQYLEVVVQEGDSLWTIAEKYHKINGMKRDEFIVWVQTENQLNTAMIQVGDVLVLPVNSAHSAYSDSQLAFRKD
ncbi:cell division suppressor protein YneA [Bacillus sp. FJAT-42315]|uniref:cell division suppressor protein YneA n=1 Tax=Bacillus sp. FJAT-42315 TaxID=2014077 RepID=UPI000C24089F|nr:LysM peptidoglycan-binding domain-containing protein [Bacillus sp. FJAT-42315]